VLPAPDSPEFVGQDRGEPIILLSRALKVRGLKVALLDPGDDFSSDVRLKCAVPNGIYCELLR
jgi:hypothetical protein